MQMEGKEAGVREERSGVQMEGKEAGVWRSREHGWLG